MGRGLHPPLRVLCGFVAMLVVFAPAVPREGSEGSPRTGHNVVTASILTPTFNQALLPKGGWLSGRSAGGPKLGSWRPMAAVAPCGLLLPGVCLAWRLPSLPEPAVAPTELQRKPGPRAPPTSVLT
jgi:hypothetical protein